MNSDKQLTKDFLEENRLDAIKLRFSGKLLRSEAAPNEVLEQLIDTRQRLDRIEGILLEVNRERRKLKELYTEARVIREDAWDEVVRQTSESRAVSGTDYSTGDERRAKIKPKVFSQIWAERHAEELSVLADDIVRDIRQAYHGLDGVRQDLMAQLKNTKYESYLEH